MTTKQIGTIGAVLSLTLIFTLLLVYNKFTNGGSSGHETVVRDLRGSYALEINKESWSPEITLGVGPLSYDIGWGARGDNTPYWVKINDGKPYLTPARKDQKRLGWKAPHFPNQIAKIRFKLAECDLRSAEIAFTIR